MKQKREPMNKNRIRGGVRRTSGPSTMKSISIKAVRRIFGGCAWEAVELTSGGLRPVLAVGTEPTVRKAERGAGVSRRHSRVGCCCPKA